MPTKPVNPRAWPRPEYLALGRGHRMAYRLAGHPQGEPWLLVHGGPGSGCQPGMLAPLDLARQRAIAPDQRGCGASRPPGRTQGNHTARAGGRPRSLAPASGHSALVAAGGFVGHVGGAGLRAGAPAAGAAAGVARRVCAQPARDRRVVAAVAAGAAAARSGTLLADRAGRCTALGADPADTTAAKWNTRCCIAARCAALGLAGIGGGGATACGAACAMRPGSSMQRWRRRSGASGPVCGVGSGVRWHAPAIREPTGPTAAPAQKFRVQGHYLRHRGFMRPGPRWIGRCSRWACRAFRWTGCTAASTPCARPPTAGAGPRWPRSAVASRCSGHLGHEPDMLATLRARVRSGLP